MEAVSTSETSVNFYQTTQHNIPEESHLHIRRRQNLKPHTVLALSMLRTKHHVQMDCSFQSELLIYLMFENSKMTISRCLSTAEAQYFWFFNNRNYTLPGLFK
jgi:hypothetical protein